MLLELANKAMAMRLKHSVATEGKLCNFGEWQMGPLNSVPFPLL